MCNRLDNADTFFKGIYQHPRRKKKKKQPLSSKIVQIQPKAGMYKPLTAIESALIPPQITLNPGISGKNSNRFAFDLHPALLDRFASVNGPGRVFRGLLPNNLARVERARHRGTGQVIESRLPKKKVAKECQ